MNKSSLPVLVDANFSMPTDGAVPPIQRFEEKGIEDSVFFNQEFPYDSEIGKVTKISLRHPSRDEMSAFIKGHKLNLHDPVHIYDHDGGAFSAPRAAFLFAAAGFTNISILDRPPIHGQSGISREKFDVSGDHFLSMSDAQRDYGQELKTIDFRVKRGDMTFIDGGSNTRPFTQGTDLFTPYTHLVEENAYGLQLKSESDLRDMFKSCNLLQDRNAPLLCTCNFSVLACVGAFALRKAGYKNVKILKNGWMSLFPS